MTEPVVSVRAPGERHCAERAGEKFGGPLVPVTRNLGIVAAARDRAAAGGRGTAGRRPLAAAKEISVAHQS